MNSIGDKHCSNVRQIVAFGILGIICSYLTIHTDIILELIYSYLDMGDYRYSIVYSTPMVYLRYGLVIVYWVLYICILIISSYNKVILERRK